MNATTSKYWEHVAGDGPHVAVAVHDGHDVRPEVRDLMELPEAGRLREEDPFTGEWAAMAPTRLVALRSRFEVDLNRPREMAVYRRPEDAWGLNVWRNGISDDAASRSLEQYDNFYACLHWILEQKERRYGRFVLFDLHTYNHRREGPQGPEADPAGNPQVNIGTGTMDRARWGPVVDRFMSDLRAYPFPGGQLDVRENVKFKGGNVPAWTHRSFPESGCCLAIEFKKFFMDEWTGEPDRALVDAIGAALGSTVDGVLDELTRR